MEEKLGRRLWTAALTGVPFGIYKCGLGWHLYHHGQPALGTAAMLWGAVDIALNVLAVAFPQRIAWCLLANIGRRIDGAIGKRIWEDILLAIDTTASFLIVSGMVLLGRLPLEPELVGLTWNLAVVGNVLSVGLDQLYRAIWSRRVVRS